MSAIIGKVNSCNDYLVFDYFDLYHDGAKLVIPMKYAPHPNYNNVAGVGISLLPSIVISLCSIIFLILGNNIVGGVGLTIALFLTMIVIFYDEIADIMFIKTADIYNLKSFYFHRRNNNDDTYHNILSILENDITRNDFITLLHAIENKNVSPEESRKIYANMEKVALAERELERDTIKNIAEKYEAQVEALKEIRNI